MRFDQLIRNMQNGRENSEPSAIQWDGDPETAEAFVRAKAVEPKTGMRPRRPFPSDEDPVDYINEQIEWDLK